MTSAGPNPHTRQVLGRAEGLAGETGGVRSQHGLIAYLWGEEGLSAFQLEWWGTTAPAVVEALEGLGLRVPTVPRREPDRTPWGEPVFVPLERYGDVVRALSGQLHPGTCAATATTTAPGWTRTHTSTCRPSWIACWPRSQILHDRGCVVVDDGMASTTLT